MHAFEGLLILLVSAVALTACARYLKLPYPSLLALGGTALAFIPNAPTFQLDPQLTLALFVAPVLLDAAFDTSLRDLKRYWIPVMALVVFAVGTTTVMVAWLVHSLVPDIPWAAAVALGAIVAPPDAAAASAILRQLRIPYRMVVILEGESLLNDATALLIYRLAVSVAMGATTFSSMSVPPLALAVIGSVIVGFVLAQVSIRLVEKITDVPSAIVLQFAFTFGLWILADELGLSAIVTVVVYAITASRIAPQRTPARMRLPAYAVWETAVFVLNVLAFVLIGLQLRPILHNLEPNLRTHYLQIAAAVFGTVVAVRIAWIFIYNRAAWLKSKIMGPGYWPGDYLPSIAGSVIVSWCGMRGIVTLATAYALPTATSEHGEFPYRDLILLCAFCVVVGTLVLQGMTLRPLIKLLRIKDDGLVDREVRKAREALSHIALEIIDGDGSPEAKALRAEFTSKLPSDDGGASSAEHNARRQLRSRIVKAQRDALVRMRDDNEIGDDAFHRIEERLDWIEVNVR